MERQGSEESEGQLQALTGTLGSLDSLDTLLTARQRVYTVCLRALTHENAKETSRCKGDKSLTDKPPNVCRTRWVSYDGMTRGEAKAALVKFLQKHCGMPLTVSVLRLSAPPALLFPLPLPLGSVHAGSGCRKNSFSLPQLHGGGALTHDMPHHNDMT